MRKLLLAAVAFVSIAGIASSASAITTISVLWADNPSFDTVIMGTDLPRITDGSIDGGLIGEGLAGYSTSWTGVAGETKQLDVFISFNSDYNGLSAAGISVGFDNEGNNVLNVVAAREFNIGRGGQGCSGDNICNWGKLSNAQLTALSPGVSAIVESGPGSGGAVQTIEGATLGASIVTNNATQIATLRMGSIIFEIEAGPSASTAVTPFFVVEDGIIADNGANVSGDTMLFGATASRIPEPTSVALIGLALVGLGVARRR